MTIPFIDLFKKAKARFFTPDAPVVSAPTRLAPMDKPAGERLSKTVLPNTVRNLSAPDPFKVASGSSSSRTGAPSTVAFAAEPKAERAISLRLSEILDQMPGEYVKPAESFDANRGVSLNATEIEKGMASGQPTVSLASIYEQVPDIFLKAVPPGDATQVKLPLSKVTQQFEAFQVRSDQLSDNAVPQLETPFLQVTIEDTKRFGTSIAPIQASAHPPVKVEPATARTLATAEPEEVAREKVAPFAHKSGSIPFDSKKSSLPSPSPETSSSPTRIPFHLPPNGTGAPASERVPASASGPPVPNSSPKPATPARIPFKIAPPSSDLRPKLTLVPGVDPKDEVKQPEKPRPVIKKDEPMVALTLQVIMKNLPAFQLSGALPEIPADVRVKLPCSLVESQLPSGRVAIDPKVFHAALPEAFRHLFVVDPTETPVLLPLQEVLKNLPETALKMRADQEAEEAVEHFETPFSLQAEEDERRFRLKSAPAAAKPAESMATEVTASAADPAQIELTLADKTEAAPVPEAKALEPEKPAEVSPEKEAAPEKEEKNEAKEFLTRASSLPGVTACSISFADGLSLAGNLPPDAGADGLCAMAPSLLQKIEKHMADTKLGSLLAVTLHCEKFPLSFLMQGNVCLTVMHNDRQLAPENQEKLAGMLKELSQVYAPTGDR
ncbi:MAG: hypothetical protein QOG67_3549 [Verrucomicrobiota bacterium]|jgi:predicted regulator of Ras-like GTPase activity (Roadblock/LC7/MglB family)